MQTPSTQNIPPKAVKSPLLSPHQKTRTGYLPTLDGWRALAILAVIFTHDSLHSFGPLNTGWLVDHGKCGVDLFFAISGLLICSRLLEEEQVFHSISLRNFYVRRAFRILPPALAYLAAIAVLIRMGVLDIGLRQWLSAVFFFRNYSGLLGHLGPDSFFTNHFWSLAVEEHFYFILPALLVLTQKRWRLQVLCGLVLLMEAHRILVLQSRPWDMVLFHTDVRLDGLLVPAIFAVLIQSCRVREAATKWLRVWPVLLVGAVIVISFGDSTYCGTTLLSVLLPLTILGAVLNPHRRLAMALEWRPLRYLGRISYSVYLWQQLFLNGHYAYMIGYPLGVLERTPLRYVATFALSIASYHLLELPMIRLGHKLAPPATQGRGDLAEDTLAIRNTTDSPAARPQADTQQARLH